MAKVVDDVIGITDEMVQAYRDAKAAKNRAGRDRRVCVCGHTGKAHFTTDGSSVDNPTGTVGCQAGRVPCQCNSFKWVLTADDVRSFIQKTDGAGSDHALMRGIVSTVNRGFAISWREGVACFNCKRPTEEVGNLTPIAYNERGFEAFRSTNINMLMCEGCRENIRMQAHGV